MAHPDVVSTPAARAMRSGLLSAALAALHQSREQQAIRVLAQYRHLLRVDAGVSEAALPREVRTASAGAGARCLKSAVLQKLAMAAALLLAAAHVTAAGLIIDRKLASSPVLEIIHGD